MNLIRVLELLFIIAKLGFSEDFRTSRGKSENNINEGYYCIKKDLWKERIPTTTKGRKVLQIILDVKSFV